METRINALGETEVWVQPDGLPGIWFRKGICHRCKPFEECLGLSNLSVVEWHKLNDLISEVNSPEALKETLGKFGCTNSKSLCSAVQCSL